MDDDNGKSRYDHAAELEQCPPLELGASWRGQGGLA